LFTRWRTVQQSLNQPGLEIPRLNVQRIVDVRRYRRFISPLAILVLWQIASSTGVLPATKLAAPTKILEALWSLAASGVLFQDIAVSLARVTIGLIVGVALGAALAVIAGLSRIGDDVVDPPLQMLRTLPHLGLIPLLILWFGVGELPKIVLIAFAALFPVYLTLLGGIRAIDPKLIEAARVFGLNRWGLIRDVILPGALPPALVGLRYSLGAAWLTLVVVEQVNADRGIGFLIMDARDFLRTDVIVVGLLLYAVLGLATDALVRAVERRVLRWRPSLVPGETQ
jgi:sulfonate transport system permease protein